MKKISIILLSCFFIITLSWCTNDKQVEQLRQQNELLQQQIQNEKAQKEEEKKAQKEALNQKEVFENNLKCQERGDELKLQYNNVFSTYYNEYKNTCYVRYYDKSNNNEITEWPMDNFWPILKREPLEGFQTILRTVRFREIPDINGDIIQNIDPSNKVNILYSREINWHFWYNIQFNGIYWRISEEAFKK